MTDSLIELTGLKYAEILSRNSKLADTMQGPRYDVRIVSNIVVSQLSGILEYALRSKGVAAVVQVGDYDNIVQDTQKYADSQLVVVFFELCNIIDGLQFEIELLDEMAAEAIFQKAVSEIQLVFRNLASTPLVLFNRFTAIHFSSSDPAAGRFEALAGRLNDYLDKNKPLNVQFVDLERVVGRLGVKSSVDSRYFYSSRALYSVDFLKQYVTFALPSLLAVNGKLKKALILDCDGTLWKGILGEDGEAGIETGPATRTGAVFAEVQSILLSWSRRGVLLGLCSKNNPADVDRVLATHPGMRIRDEALVVKRVNWQDKATNLREIARELQIGLDSIVLLDDSAFEAELIRSQLPEVDVLQVPANLSEYPGMLRDHAGWFLSGARSAEDLVKAEMYRSQAARVNAQASFAGIDDYLASLGITIVMLVDDPSTSARLAQLSQKTNQFNLTTTRYTEAEVRTLMDRRDALVFAIQVADRFGDSGIVGLCVVTISSVDKAAAIETFLLSCRVIGRNIEFAVMDYLMAQLEPRGIEVVTAKYIRTPKNDQVKDFFARCSFATVHEDTEGRAYSTRLDRYVPSAYGYLAISEGRPRKVGPA